MSSRSKPHDFQYSRKVKVAELDIWIGEAIEGQARSVGGGLKLGTSYVRRWYEC